MVEQIVTRLGFDGSKFKEGALAAEKQVKGLSEGFSKFGLGAIAGLGAVTAYFKGVLDYAQNLTGELTENQQRVKDFADGIDSFKRGANEAGVAIVGTINGIGEWVGRLASVALYGEKVVAQNEKIEADTNKVAANLEKAKKHASEFNSITAELKKLSEAKAAQAEKNLSLDQQILNAAVKLNEAKYEQAKEGQSALERRRDELATARAQGDLEALLAQRAAKEKADLAAFNERARLSKEQELEIFKLQNKAAGTLTIEEKARLEVLQLQGKEKRLEVELEDLLKIRREDRTKGENERILTITKATAELDKQIARKGAFIASLQFEQQVSDSLTSAVAEQVTHQEAVQKILEDTTSEYGERVKVMSQEFDYAQNLVAAGDARLQSGQGFTEAEQATYLAAQETLAALQAHGQQLNVNLASANAVADAIKRGEQKPFVAGANIGSVTPEELIGLSDRQLKELLQNLGKQYAASDEMYKNVFKVQQDLVKAEIQARLRMEGLTESYVKSGDAFDVAVEKSLKWFSAFEEDRYRSYVQEQSVSDHLKDLVEEVKNVRKKLNYLD